MPDPAPADPVAARLGYLSACIDAAITSPESFDLPVLLADWGRALAGLEMVLKYHKPLGGDWGAMCAYCWSRGGSRRPWPCPEYLELAAALLAKEDGHA
jgi:hypothetical protein